MLGIPVQATIVAASGKLPVVVSAILDIETICVKSLNRFFLKSGFSEVYEYFGHVRVSTVHPFALFLFNEIENTAVDLSILPSVTITDSSDTEAMLLLGKEEVSIVLTEAVYQGLKALVAKGDLITSQSNLTKLKTALDAGLVIEGVQKTYRANHIIDFNIWTDNKIMTGNIYDATKLFALNETVHLRENGIDLQGGITGRRSGDINIEFGKLLYGANLSVPCTATLNVLEFTMESIPTELLIEPTFHAGESE